MHATDLRSPGHAELMDGVYRWQRHIYDLTRKYYLLGRDRLIDGLDVPAGGTVLEIGCGTGRNIVLAARRYPQARFFGLDISAEMLETAHGAIGREGLAGRVSLARGDATGFDAETLFGMTAFDRVFISYSLSMIPGWPKALVAALGTLGPGGSLHIVDFGNPVTVAGMYVASGDLVHADRHGAVVIPKAVAGKISAAASLIARREAVLIGASKEPGFNFERLKKAMGDASEIH